LPAAPGLTTHGFLLLSMTCLWVWP